jgi:glycerophosphoryl diester phosphodiesterase
MRSNFQNLQLIHRGLAKKKFKENTLSAFKYSFKKKYGIETDLQVTKDNQLICFHDFNLKRKFKLNVNVKDINYPKLKKISNKNKAPIPLLIFFNFG